MGVIATLWEEGPVSNKVDGGPVWVEDTCPVGRVWRGPVGKECPEVDEVGGRVWEYGEVGPGTSLEVPGRGALVQVPADVGGGACSNTCVKRAPVTPPAPVSAKGPKEPGGQASSAAVTPVVARGQVPSWCPKSV